MPRSALPFTLHQLPHGKSLDLKLFIKYLLRLIYSINGASIYLVRRHLLIFFILMSARDLPLDKECFHHRQLFHRVHTLVETIETLFVGWRAVAYHHLHLRARCLWRPRVLLNELVWMRVLDRDLRLDSFNYLAGNLLWPVVLL